MFMPVEQSLCATQRENFVTPLICENIPQQKLVLTIILGLIIRARDFTLFQQNHALGAQSRLLSTPSC